MRFRIALFLMVLTALAVSAQAQGRGQGRDRDRDGKTTVVIQSGSFHHYNYRDDLYDRRPPGWEHGRKAGWRGCDLPPGQAKKYGCYGARGYVGNGRWPDIVFRSRRGSADVYLPIPRGD